MDVSLHADIIRCHSCGHEILIITRKVTYPKQLSASQPFGRCVRCGSDDIIHLVPRTQTITISEDEIERLSGTLDNNLQCAQCRVSMPLLSGMRADLVFEMEEHLRDVEELIKKWTEAVPFCTRCMEQEPEDVLIDAAVAYLHKTGKPTDRDTLQRSRKKWKR
jgi:hypothetical protein